ncbi:hypothetical protein FTW19_24810 [Terriglobus albidus]|uniref:Uncharacterized protein n=1 Tax=Terriglobus albidus TaxID=1592106 RepID=A0A5B9EKI7_9BACT|nr:hypothetical protein [Terriglobus albidus]QEE30937.1 hypothetical protein FTW19_24810 [Terriglobus albidus]
MSTVKSPVEKKRLSLLNDCRNMYWWNDKASRKLIPLGRQRGHQALRRAANRSLQNAGRFIDEDAAIAAEQEARDSIKARKRDLFRKMSDFPLGKVLNAQRTGDRTPLYRSWSKT